MTALPSRNADPQQSAAYWRAMYEDQLRRKRLLHERYELLRGATQTVAKEIRAEAVECVADGGSDLCPTCIEQTRWAEALCAALAPANREETKTNG